MKIGQVLSLMAGVLPDEVAEQLLALHSSAPPMSYELVVQVFEEAYGRRPQEVFKEFEKPPFAAASIGQVHGRGSRMDAGRREGAVPGCARQSSTTSRTWE